MTNRDTFLIFPRKKKKMIYFIKVFFFQFLSENNKILYRVLSVNFGISVSKVMDYFLISLSCEKDILEINITN